MDRFDIPSRTWAGSSVLALAIVVPAVCLAADIEIRFDADRLWIRTSGQVAAQELLEAITEKTGVEFLIDPELAGRRLSVEIEELDLERALARLVMKIPEAGGHAMLYMRSASGTARLARVTVFGVGTSPTGDPVPAVGGSAKMVVVAVPTPSPEDFEAQKERLIEMGVSQETAQEYIEILNETVRLQNTPGAVEALMRSDRYRKVRRAIAVAEGKFPPEEEETPTPR